QADARRRRLRNCEQAAPAFVGRAATLRARPRHEAPAGCRWGCCSWPRRSAAQSCREESTRRFRGQRKADLPAFARALGRVRRSLGAGGKVRLYDRPLVLGSGIFARGGTWPRLYTMNVRRNSITTLPVSVKPVVFTLTIPTLGRDFDSRLSSTSLRE